MPIRFGDATPPKFRFGDASPSALYFGDQKVWSSFGIAGVQASGAASGTIPAHSAGDLIVLFVRGATGFPSKPAAAGTVPAWVDIDIRSAGYAVCRTVQFKATASNHTTGTWTNVDSMIAVVISGTASSPIGGHAIPGIEGSTANKCDAPSVTMSKTDGTSLLLHFFGWGDSVSNISAIGAAPAGYTKRASGIYASNKVGIALLTKDVTTSDGAVTLTATSACYWNGATVEILAA